MPYQCVKIQRPAMALMFLFILLTGFTFQAKANISTKLSDGNELILIGIGVHQELRNDIYLGALFGPAAVTDVEQLKNDNVAKQMSFKFLSNYSNRKLARHWKERMAMNNARSVWQPFTKEIVNFSKLFKRPFQRGDKLNIDHLPGIGTQVYLNSTLFMTINKPGFTDILLNIWLGNIPPTKAFKKSIRGQDDTTVKSDYIAQYEGIQSIIGRFDADLPNQTEVAIVSAPVKITTITPKKVSVTKLKKVKKLAKKIPAKTNKKPPSTKKVTAKVAKVSPPSKRPVIKKANNETISLTQKPENKTQNTIRDEDIPAKKIAIVDKKPIQPVIDEDFFDADLVTGSYTRDLINAIKRHQNYPRRAIMKKQQGDVTAQVTISSSGDVINIQLIERSGSRILDRAVARIIKQTAPFEPIPKQLKLTEFVFDVPISFKL